MSVSNILAVDTFANYKDIYANFLETEAISTDSAVISGNLQVLNHIQLATITPLSLTWAGADQNGIVCSKPNGHVLVQFGGTPLGIGAIARFQLTNSQFGQTFGGTLVSKGPFAGAGESLTARLIDVCVSFRVPGAITVAIINNGVGAFSGNLEFDYCQF